jgi:hypothetical protein
LLAPSSAAEFFRPLPGVGAAPPVSEFLRGLPPAPPGRARSDAVFRVSGNSLNHFAAIRGPGSVEAAEQKSEEAQLRHRGAPGAGGRRIPRGWTLEAAARLRAARRARLAGWHPLGPKLDGRSDRTAVFSALHRLGLPGAGASPAFPPEVGEAEPTEAPGSPAHPNWDDGGRSAPAPAPRWTHRTEDGRAPPSPAPGPPRAHRVQHCPHLCRRDVCGDRGQESRSRTRIGSARAASLALRFRTFVGGAWNPKLDAAGEGSKFDRAALRAAQVSLWLQDQRGVPPTPGTVGRRAWRSPTRALLRRRLSYLILTLLDSLLVALSSKQFQRFLLLLLKRLNMKNDYI